MFKKFFKQFDWILFVVLALLMLIGTLVIYSTGVANEEGLLYAKRQLLFALIGIPILFIVSVINYDIIRGYLWLLYTIVCGTLVTVLFFGKLIRGTRSWFDVGAFNLQPSEFAKVLVIVVLASYFAKHTKDMYQFRHIMISGVLAFIPIGLILLQPDLGSAIIIVVIWAGMLVLAGIKKTHMAIMATVSGIFAVIAWNMLLRPYQKDRIMTFIRPQEDPLGQGYNVIQSMIAVGSGGIGGKGLGHGSQSQLNFLPEQHTDFVFAVLAEELGFMGALALLSLFVLLIMRIIRAVRLSRNNFGFFIAAGVAIMLLTQILVNVGMNLGIMPVAGIPLPFVSYGGSSILASLIAIGLVESVIIRRKKRVSLNS